MVTHDSRAAAIADRILFLADGLIVRELGRTDADQVLDCDVRTRRVAVIRVALKGLLGRKLRAFLTAFAIVLGVATVSGTYVLTDSISDAFDNYLHRGLPGNGRRRDRKVGVRVVGQRQRHRAGVRRVAATEGSRASGGVRRHRRGRRRGAADRLERQGDPVRRCAEPRLLGGSHPASSSTP